MCNNNLNVLHPEIELLRYIEGAGYSPTPYSIGLQPEYFNKK